MRDYNEDEEFKVPNDLDEFDKELQNKVASYNGSMIDPNNKNLVTWALGILVLTVIAVCSVVVYLYQDLLSEKNKRIEYLEKKDCKDEIKYYLELQNEVIRNMNNSTSEFKNSVRNKINESDE